MSNWIELEKKYYMGVAKRLPVVLVRGEGVRVWDEDGNAYLDLVAGIAVNVLGHGNKALVEAIAKQAAALIHTSNLYYTIPQVELAQLLVEHSAGDQVFFGNSGAEANEGALKLARKYGHVKRNGAYEIITTENSFHGRTLATVAATGQVKFQKPFTPMPTGFKTVAFNDLEALEGAIAPQTAAVMLEVVQGESGVHPADPAYVRGVRALCDRYGLLMIVDEIQTGMGRTGKLFGYEQYGVEPDVFTMAKGLAGGVPIGAFLAKNHAQVFELSDHGSTFGGNPLACAAGVVTMRAVLEKDLSGNAERVGRYFLNNLEALKAKSPAIAEVRGVGLMVAIDLKEDRAGDVVLAALKRGVILNNTGPHTVRMVPPLILTEADVDEAVVKIAAAIEDVA
ncbi:MAG: acetylornithine/succinylornithine family transaminase [Chloroflexota bacterium]